MAAPAEGTRADAAPNTVAPSVLEERAPAIRYIDAAQSNIIMESGTKNPTVGPGSALLPGCTFGQGCVSMHACKCAGRLANPD